MTDPNDFTVDPEPHLPAGCTEYMGELVTVQVSDSIDDCLVLILHGASADPLDSTTVEVGRDEAREIIAGLAALL